MRLSLLSSVGEGLGGCVFDMNSLSGANNMNVANNSGNNMGSRLSASRSNVNAANFNNAEFGSWSNSINNLDELHNNLRNLNNSLGNNLNNLNRNLNLLNNISTNWNYNMSQLANQRSAFDNSNNGWFANTQWSSGNVNNQNQQGLSPADNTRNSATLTLGNQTGVGVFTNASGTRILIGNGTTGNLLEHANWPSSVYMLDVNASR
uniref:Uncharacterized protein n=2 Tax=Parascaris univalens TaxID=6257 RepID=A0A915BQ30_PARUN